MIYTLFFLSGISGLIYQVIWVRQFAHVFGSTVHSVSLVTAVFMFGLGIGSYWAGKRSDRWIEISSLLPLKMYAFYEIFIALWGLLLTLILPNLERFSPLISAYSTDASGWYELSTGSLFWRLLIAVLFLAPITLVMGATLTVLIRHLVAKNIPSAGKSIGYLYGVNTAGAALGCFFVDFYFIPYMGLVSSQLLAIGLNLVAGWGALQLTKRKVNAPRASKTKEPDTIKKTGTLLVSNKNLIIVGLVLTLSGFVGMGLEMAWFRFLSSFLGSLRATFSLLLTIILCGMGLGSFLAGWLSRRIKNIGLLFIGVQLILVVSTLGSFLLLDPQTDFFDVIKQQRHTMNGSGITWTYLSIVSFLVGIPALCMGATYPLGNSLIQNILNQVGKRAGLLYLFNTSGGVLGSLLVGFIFLARFGMQNTIQFLAILILITIGLLLFLTRMDWRPKGWIFKSSSIAILVIVLCFVGGWTLLESNYLVNKIYARTDVTKNLIHISEGLTDTIAITELPSKQRVLYLDGMLMSGTMPGPQRYMRGFSHYPLLHQDNPEKVLVISFGVGVTANAASLHNSVKTLEIADLSRHVLEHGHFFEKWNGAVLKDPRTKIFVNDGRHHLLMQKDNVYDLVTLEPPPIATAGVASLYSKEFYELAHKKLKPGGHLTQWLPAYQVDGDTVLSIIRAFIEAFPNTIMLSGYRQHFILMGKKDGAITISLESFKKRLAANPRVQQDLDKFSLGRPYEYFGSYVADYTTLLRATENHMPITDDWPYMEYSLPLTRIRETLIPKTIFNVKSVGQWCPDCVSEKEPLKYPLFSYLQILKPWYESENFRFRSPFEKSPDFDLKVENPHPTLPIIFQQSGYLQEVFNK